MIFFKDILHKNYLLNVELFILSSTLTGDRRPNNGPRAGRYFTVSVTFIVHIADTCRVNGQHVVTQIPSPVQLYASQRGRAGAERGRHHRCDGEM